MAYDRKDHFYRRAKREGRASRAAYKLSELQDRFSIVKNGATIIDLGAAPGGWLQELSEMAGTAGNIVGIDLLPLKIHPPKNCAFILGNIEHEESQRRISELCKGKADVIVSDMAPNLSGVAFADAYRSYELSVVALGICRKFLKAGGNFVVKIFPGDEFESFLDELKRNFRAVKVVIPKATRKTSSERYIVATGFQDTKNPQDMNPAG